MDHDQFWQLIGEARAAAAEQDSDSVAERATQLLAELPADKIVGAEQVLRDLLAESYLCDLWGAAYLINGGASDDGFEYFRGWLISEGREVFERAVADPDSLADVPAVRRAAAVGQDLDGEPILGIAWTAYHRRTGEQLPSNAATISYPSITFGWDFEDHDERSRRLPRLSQLKRGQAPT
ncbi:DUF4240 domain-containing protein [Actinomadura rudentiformis]|uniref:DUF4240 domain-containing protein n=1 Tax=Actinomadura rudentiformis TaxID=359158 RepID=A0A6H9YQM4_9ACTN|nr:DUF4240 domain-containing protein [Actinomadura rudentiformis]KAB2350214.1 DUF4240 domain-containing protein [Actinomadura rudentiformis]